MIETADSKKCPRCAEWVRIDATACRYCGRPFNDKAARSSRIAQRSPAMRWMAIAVLSVALGVPLMVALSSYSGDGASSAKPVATPTEAFTPDAADNAIAADMDVLQKGVNAAAAQSKVPGAACLSPLEGSSPQLVDAVKGTLRDPDSFEHISTRLYPPAREGRDTIEMQFRSRNGFGGMVLSEADGTLDPKDCSITLDKVHDLGGA